MASRSARSADPFAALGPLTSALERPPFAPVLFVSGDDDWIVAEARRRIVADFRQAHPDAEVSEYDAALGGVSDAVADAATIALFTAHRLVTLEADELLRGRRLSADELDALLDEARDADELRAKQRLARKARGLLATAGIAPSDDPADAARRLAGRVKRGERSGELQELLEIAGPGDDVDAAAADPLLDYLGKATPGDNVLVVFAVAPDREHGAVEALRRVARTADLSVPDDAARRSRLASLGLERSLERRVPVDPEVFEILTDRGRLAARPFLSELDRLIDTASGPRVTAEMAARLVADERKEYGSDFVEAVAERRPKDALRILSRLVTGDEFTAFRPFGKERDAAPAAGAKKGPRGDAAFFPLLGLLAGEIRRMLTLKAALLDRGLPERRVDYRTFADRVLPDLRSPRPGLPVLPLDGHPFVLHKAYLAAQGWTLPELVAALIGVEGVDRGVKSGSGLGPALLQDFVLSNVVSRVGASR